MDNRERGFTYFATGFICFWLGLFVAVCNTPDPQPTTSVYAQGNEFYLANAEYNSQSKTLDVVREGKINFAKVNQTYKKSEILKMCKAVK